jgi:glycosyltransferase involved in cell wall biosynthesis
MGVKQGLWYSHSKKSISLKFSHFFANEIFTSTSNAIPISSSKINYVGHGIRTERFTNGLSTSQLSRSGVVAVGRVVPIKRVEFLIDAVFNSGIQEFRITCLGPFEEEDAYPQRLKSMAKLKKVDLALKGAIPYAYLPALLINFDFVFTGTPSSVDKAVIEGALSGCFVISSEKQALELTGMDKVFEALGFKDIPTLEVQLLTLSGLPTTEKELLRSKLSARARELNDLDRTTLEILRKIESSI